MYRRSLCLLLAASAQNLFPKNRLLVGHSLGSGYYYTLQSEVELTQAAIDALENEMRSIVEKNMPITSEFISYQEASDYFKNENLPTTLHQMDFMCPPRVKIVKLQEFRNVYFGPVVQSTGFLKTFELKKYAEGFLLRFPKSTEPNAIPPFEDQPKLIPNLFVIQKMGNTARRFFRRTVESNDSGAQNQRLYRHNRNAARKVHCRNRRPNCKQKKFVLS